jgi:hypothetical protein
MIYLVFMVYLTMFSVSWGSIALNDGMIVNNELGRMWKKVIVA